MAGASLQGVFRNPLAEPSIIGVSSGAAVGAVAAIVLGFSIFNTGGITMVAFLTSLLATSVVYLVARTYGQTEVTTLILAGIAVNATAGAFTGLLTYIADDEQLRSITFWMLGSIGGATWPVVSGVTPFFLVGLVLLPFWARSLNLLALGDRDARHLGVSTERVRLSVIVLCALVTGAAVSVAGIIGFVGLVVPHIIRLIVRTGPPFYSSHQYPWRGNGASLGRSLRPDRGDPGGAATRCCHGNGRRPLFPLASSPDALQAGEASNDIRLESRQRQLCSAG